MKKFMMSVALSLLAAGSALAQSDYTRFQVFGGYSHFSADVRFHNPFDSGGSDFFDQREGLHGVGFSAAGNFNKSLGVVADFSYHKRQVPVLGGDIDFS